MCLPQKRMHDARWRLGPVMRDEIFERRRNRLIADASDEQQRITDQCSEHMVNALRQSQDVERTSIAAVARVVPHVVRRAAVRHERRNRLGVDGAHGLDDARRGKLDQRRRAVVADGDVPHAELVLHAIFVFVFVFVAS